ncbi:MAG: cardiolipin synthase [Clostridia bacterium]|nr:cardiolipin synthase [Clostridia bacterium]
MEAERTVIQQKRAPFSFLDIAPALRIAFVAAVVLLQIVTCWALVRFLESSAAVIYAGLELAARVATLVLLSSTRDITYRYAWVATVFVLGLFGMLLYLLWGRGSGRNALGKRLAEMADLPLADVARPENAQTLSALEREEPNGLRVARYLSGHGFPIYRCTGARYFPLGELAFDAMVDDIERAERFIYLEFFIVFEGQVWNRIFDALCRKVEEGLDVRLLYDDMGSIATTSAAFLRKLRQAGIRVQVFNPVHRYVHQLYLNYRDHRKIVAIDGRIAYTGGINLGDEYANLYPKHGHWKDTAVRLSGPGARSFTECFLRMWQAVTCSEEDFELPPVAPRRDAPGFVVPFVDDPHNNPQNTAKSVYLEMIGGARETLYLTTPYLVIDEFMLAALCQAARSGVDLRVVLPSSPDHWYIHLTGQSVYGELLRAGVRVYEYTPGFMHAKMMVADRRQAVVGSVNMDYRSFHMQYESAVWCCQGEVPEAVHLDIESVIAASREVKLEEWLLRPWYIKTTQSLLRIIAPMM